MMESSPSAGWRKVQQVMHRIRPTGQERTVLRRLGECGAHSLESLRESVNTQEEDLYKSISRLEDKGFVYARGHRHVEITDDGLAALELPATEAGR